MKIVRSFIIFFYFVFKYRRYHLVDITTVLDIVYNILPALYLILKSNKSMRYDIYD